MNSILLAFITGLTTGGVSCMAVQGGLLTSSISTQINTKGKVEIDGITKEAPLKAGKFVGMFLVSKIIAYTILGALLGYVGSILTPSPKILAVLQLLIGFFLLGTIGRLLNLHPIFRYFAIQPPKFTYRIARKQSQSAQLFTPAFLGALTVFIPCGVTQAMMLVALGTGSVISAALVMFAFTLGTSPVFFTIGVAALQFLKKKAFVYVSSLVVFILAIIAINNAMGLFGSVHTLQNYWFVISGKEVRSQNTVSADYDQGVQEATITVTGRGYTSNVTTLKVGVPVKLKLVTNNVYSCARAFTIPSLNISKILPSTGEEVLEFTPTKTGRLAYSCSMGMYTGSFNVVE